MVRKFTITNEWLSAFNFLHISEYTIHHNESMIFTRVILSKIFKDKRMIQRGERKERIVSYKVSIQEQFHVIIDVIRRTKMRRGSQVRRIRHHVSNNREMISLALWNWSRGGAQPAISTIRSVLREFWSICRLRVPGMQGWHGRGFGRGGTEQYRCARFPASWSSHSEHPIVAALSPPVPSPTSSSASAASQHVGDRRAAQAQPQYAVSSGENGSRVGRALWCAIESQERGKSSMNPLSSIHYLSLSLERERWINVPWSIKIRSNQRGNGATSTLVK